jgi:hypothetical protein
LNPYEFIGTVNNKAPNPGLAETLRKTFENEGVAVLEAEDLD